MEVFGHCIIMSDAIKDAAMKKARKMNDELNELRRKTKHQEVSDTMPTEIGMHCERSLRKVFAYPPIDYYSID